MLLFKKILLFILSLFFIILFFIVSSTSYAKSEYNAETLEKNVRFYSIEFLDIPDENGKNMCAEQKFLPMITVEENTLLNIIICLQIKTKS